VRRRAALSRQAAPARAHPIMRPPVVMLDGAPTQGHVEQRRLPSTLRSASAGVGRSQKAILRVSDRQTNICRSRMATCAQIRKRSGMHKLVRVPFALYGSSIPSLIGVGSDRILKSLPETPQASRPAARHANGRTRHLANRSARRKGFPNNRSFLLQAPPSPPLRARQHLNSAHRTVSCTSASDSACTVPTQTR
jgi:hypothetical protein